MHAGPPERALRQIRTAVAAHLFVGVGDRELLERFIDQRDESAFAALLERHAPMVLGVCRRTLADRHLAEDVLQATFLLLARKAASIRRRESLGSWLHGTTLRLARRAASDLARATRCDRRPAPEPPPDPLADLSAREFLSILDAEIDALPEQYRAPLVLCHLEGRTRDEAATLLGWSVGQVKGRLERGLARLRRQLTRRGVVPAAALSASLVGDSASSAALLGTIPTLARVASSFADGASNLSGQVPERTLSLTEGALRTMYRTKLKAIGAAVLTVSLLGTGAGLWLGERSRAEGDPNPADNPNRPVAEGGKPDVEARRAAEQQTRANLREIALAMHNYHDANRSLPPSAICGPDGKPLLSWRVALLPFLGEAELYKQFRRDQPWDSPNNKKLLARMPAVFRVAALQPKNATATYYQVIVGNGCVFEEPGRASGAPLGSGSSSAGPMSGEGTTDVSPLGLPGLPGAPDRGGATGSPGGAPPVGPAFPMGGGPMPGPSGQGVRLVEILDGTSNTLMVVEGDADVPWTKPEDIPYSAAGRVPRLGGLFANIAHVAFADGSVNAIDKKIDEKVLRLMITRADGLPFDRDAVIDPIFTTDPDQLRRENRKLEDEVALAVRELAELKRRQREESLKQSPERRERTELDVLRLQQKRLIRERDELRREAEKLREQLGAPSRGRAPFRE